MIKGTTIFDIDPVAKPRMTRRDKFAPSKRAGRYFVFCNELRLKARIKDFELGKKIEVLFLIPMPKSWSKKKKAEMNGKSHEQTPDTDNLLKAVCDALREDDSNIWRKTGAKFWAEEGKIIFLENSEESGTISDYLHLGSISDKASIF